MALTGQKLDLDSALKYKLNITREKLSERVIKVLLLAKKQNIILNRIPEKSSMMSTLKL